MIKSVAIMIDSKLLENIKGLLAQGKSTEDIYKQLLSAGFKVDDIQRHFQLVERGGSKEDTQKKTIGIIVVIGALSVAAGVFSFIAANWGVMTRVQKITVIVCTIMFSYWSGWRLRENSSYPKTGEALLLAGGIFYGAGIFLIGQMFHTSASWPDGFILWMAGVIPMGFALDSYLFFYLAIPLGLAALIGHPLNLFDGFHQRNPFLLTSSALLFAITIITFMTGYVLRKKVPKDSTMQL